MTATTRPWTVISVDVPFSTERSSAAKFLRAAVAVIFMYTV